MFSNIPFIVILIVFLNLVHWLIMENIFRTAIAKTAGSTEDKDAKTEFTVKSSNSSILIVSSILAVYGCSIFTRVFNLQILPIATYNERFMSRNSVYNISLLLLPVILTIFASCLRGISMSHLGNYFSRRLAVRGKNHRVISTGPYGYVRHPGYAANVILLGCYAFVVSGDLVVGFILYAQYMYVLLNYRIYMEEEMFVGAASNNHNSNLSIKHEYIAYKKKVPWKLIPFVV